MVLGLNLLGMDLELGIIQFGRFLTPEKVMDVTRNSVVDTIADAPGKIVQSFTEGLVKDQIKGRLGRMGGT